MNARIVTVAYPNKAYYTKVYLCYNGMVRYEIFDCRGNNVSSSDVYTEDTSKAPGKITTRALEKIQRFYQDIGLSAPLIHDFVPEHVTIGKSIAVVRKYGNYNVVASTGISSKSDVDLVKSLSYEKALIKAQDIAALCDKE